jgi:Fe-S-cluster-containing dehydrogenase component
MSRRGLLIDYDYCTGCHSCEVACKQEHDYPVGKGGIHLTEILTELPDGTQRIDYIPFPTAYCDLCAKRTARAEAPTCVKHCQAATMFYGTLVELTEIMEKKPHCVLFTPR